MVNIYIILAVIPVLVCSNNHQTSLLEDVPAVAVTATGPLPQITTSDDSVEGTTDDGIATTTSTPDEVVPTSSAFLQARCRPEESVVWINNPQFSLTLSNIAHSHFGNGKLTAIDLVKEYPILTTDCASCFEENVNCGTSKCWMYCTFDSFSELCLGCTNRYCNPALKSCLGVSDEEMPPIPTGDMTSTTTTSTFAPRKRVVRRTTAEPSEEVSNEVVSSEVASQQATYINTLPQRVSRHWYVLAAIAAGLMALIVSRMSG